MLFIVGVFGAGKDTLTNELLKSGLYHRIVSHTTRAPRVNDDNLEQNGIDYHFVDFAVAEHMISQNSFLEAKLIHDSDIYGTSVAEIQMAHDEAKTALTDIDVQGVVEYMHISDKAKAIFLLPPSYDVWQERIIKRSGGKLPDDVFERRMNSSALELDHALKSNYFHFVINDDLEQAVADIQTIHNGKAITAHDRTGRNVALDLLEALKTKI